MDRTGIYPDGFLCMFRGRPTDRPDATVRKPDTCRAKIVQNGHFFDVFVKIEGLK